MMVAVTVCKPRFFAIVARLQSQYKMVSRRLDMNIGSFIPWVQLQRPFSTQSKTRVALKLIYRDTIEIVSYSKHMIISKY